MIKRMGIGIPRAQNSTYFMTGPLYVSVVAEMTFTIFLDVQSAEPAAKRRDKNSEQ